MKLKKYYAAVAGVMIMSLLAGCSNSSTIVGKYSDDIVLGDYMGIEYTPQKTEVTDDDIDVEISSLISQGTTELQLTDGVATWGDAVNIDYVGRIGSYEFEGGSTQGAGTTITLGSSGYIDNFDEQIVGHKPGDTFDVNVTFPEDYGKDELNGQPAVFTTTLNYIVSYESPEYNDELVASLTDVSTTAEFEELKRNELTEYNSETDAQSNKQTLLSMVIEKTVFNEYPEKEMQEEIDLLIDNISQMAEANDIDVETLMMYYGFSSADDFQDYVKESVKEGIEEKMVITTIAEKEGISVTKDELSDKMSEYISQYGALDKDDLKSTYGISEEDVELQLLAEKVLNLIYDNAVPVSDASSDN